MQLVRITDFDAPELDVYARLSEGQLLNRAEPEQGIFIAESPNVIMRALESGCRPLSFLVETRHIETQAAALAERFPVCEDVPVYTADLDVLVQLTGFPMTRGILCAMRRPALLSVEEICADAKCIVILEEVENPTNIGAIFRSAAILEEVENPTNIGAIFRSAAALGVDGVLLTPGCSNPLYRRAARVSMGTVFQIPWTFIPEKPRKKRRRPLGAAEETDRSWPAGCISLLHSMGFATAAMALSEDSVPIDDPVLLSEKRLALVLGTEGDGLAAKTIAQCDYTVRIPMAHGVDSLNVAAAGAVAFYQLARR